MGQPAQAAEEDWQEERRRRVTEPLELLEEGRRLFAGPCEFFAGSGAVENLPPLGAMEIAFCGRSNVGKSSLVNALTGRKTLARVSHTPGRTQALNFFALGGTPPEEKLRIVDMPGYGYAAVAKSKVDAWTRLLHAYLQGRQTLARVFVLVDSRHGFKDSDLAMFDRLDRAAVSYQVVLTKGDQLTAAERAARLEEVAAAIARRPAAHPRVLLTSAREGDDVPQLRADIYELLTERLSSSN
jgi:GTP-binding protein